MKWPKSRKAKKSASAAGSAGTGVSPSWRAASSATIRGDAEPTWCTCSSAFGSPAMNEVRSGTETPCLRDDEDAPERERHQAVADRVRRGQLPRQGGAERLPRRLVQCRLDRSQRRPLHPAEHRML